MFSLRNTLHIVSGVIWLYDLQIKNLPYQTFNKNFYVPNSNGQFQNKILISPEKNDFTMKLGRISGEVLIH